MNLRRILAAAVAVAVFMTLGSLGASAHQPHYPVLVDGPLTSYDASLVPPEASARVVAVEMGGRSVRGFPRAAAGRTVVILHVAGLVPNRTYGAHAHNLACGSAGAAAGVHYQYVQDPATGGDPMVASTDPAYANPRNEIWLDFTTTDAGEGFAYAIVEWQMPHQRRAGSVVIHTRHTDHATGAAGARVGCISVPF